MMCSIVWSKHGHMAFVVSDIMIGQSSRSDYWNYRWYLCIM